MFDENFIRSGINIKIPDDSDQLIMGTIINNIVKNKHGKRDKKELLKIIRNLRVRNVILACTDLQILNPKSDGIKIFDTMHILANAAVREQFR